MATHDYVIANQGFPAFRSDLNNALAAIVSNNSSATEPTTMFAHMIWVDTAADPSILKIRNADNDAWITIGSLNQTADTFKLTPAGGISTDTIAELTSAAGVTVDGVILKDSQVSTDQINEKTSAAGVTIDGVLLKDGGASVSTLNTSGAVVFNDAGADVDFRVESDTNENALFVDGATGNVGVGATPSFSVDVVRSGGDAQLRLMSQATGTNGIIFRNNAAPTSGKGAILYPNGSAAGGDTMQFVVDNAERARITSGGDLYVGTTSGLVGTSDFGAIIAQSGGIFGSRNEDGGVVVFYTGGNQGAFRVLGDGDAENTNNSYGAISDIKTKQDVVDAASQWDDIKNIRVRKFRFKNNPTGPLQIGVLAQELEEVSPGLVDEHPDYEEVEVPVLDDEGNAVLNEDGTPQVTTEQRATDTTTKSVKYSILYMKAVKALQEAIERIETLEAKVAALEAK